MQPRGVKTRQNSHFTLIKISQIEFPRYTLSQKTLGGKRLSKQGLPVRRLDAGVPWNKSAWEGFRSQADLDA